MLDEQGLDGAPAEEPKTAEPAESADPVAAPLAEPATADDQPAAATEAPEAPKVRKINGPATEPIDLMEVGGSSIAKRLVPAIVALVVVLFLLRRRRS